MGDLRVWALSLAAKVLSAMRAHFVLLAVAVAAVLLCTGVESSVQEEAALYEQQAALYKSMVQPSLYKQQSELYESLVEVGVSETASHKSQAWIPFFHGSMDELGAAEKGLKKSLQEGEEEGQKEAKKKAKKKA